MYFLALAVDYAQEFAAVESDPDLSANDSRSRIKEAVDRRDIRPASEIASVV